MSTYQRQHLPPEEFNALVKEYYITKKNEYEPAWVYTSTATTKEAPDSVNKESGEITEDNPLKRNQFVSIKMPHHPAEENATGSITDQVAKDSKDSTASTHSLHDVDTGAGSGGSHGERATAQDHKANLGPVEAKDLGEKKGKDELKAEAAKLNE